MKTNTTQFYWPCMVQETSREKWLLFELICAVEIVTSNRYPVVTRYISWTHIICSVHQKPSRQKVASIWAYMCTMHTLHSNHSHCMSIPKFTDLICSVHQDPSQSPSRHRDKERGADKAWDQMNGSGGGGLLPWTPTLGLQSASRHQDKERGADKAWEQMNRGGGGGLLQWTPTLGLQSAARQRNTWGNTLWYFASYVVGSAS